MENCSRRHYIHDQYGTVCCTYDTSILQIRTIFLFFFFEKCVRFLQIMNRRKTRLNKRIQVTINLRLIKVANVGYLNWHRHISILQLYWWSVFLFANLYTIVQQGQLRIRKQSTTGRFSRFMSNLYILNRL